MREKISSADDFTLSYDLHAGDLITTGEKPIMTDISYYEDFFKSCESVVRMQKHSPRLSFGGTYKMCESEAAELGISAEKHIHLQVFNYKLAVLSDNTALPVANKELERLALLRMTVPELSGKKPVEPVKLSELVTKGLAMCSELSILAQAYLQRQGIESYLCKAKLFQDTEHGITAEDHHFVVINDNDRMFVYDPLNIKSTGRPRVYNTGLSKAEFMQKVEADKTFVLDMPPELEKRTSHFDVEDTHHLGYGAVRRPKVNG